MASLQDIVNEDDRTIELNNSDLLNWNIPKISESEVYQTLGYSPHLGLNIKLKLLNVLMLLVKIKNITIYLIKKLLKVLKINVTNSCILDFPKLLLNH